MLPEDVLASDGVGELDPPLHAERNNEARSGTMLMVQLLMVVGFHAKSRRCLCPHTDAVKKSARERRPFSA